jgi:hypothetical protein
MNKINIYNNNIMENNLNKLPMDIKQIIFKYMSHPTADMIQEMILKYERYLINRTRILDNLCATGRLDPRYINNMSFNIYSLCTYHKYSS